MSLDKGGLALIQVPANDVLHDYQLTSVQVRDNGRGISPDDYESVALRDYTSKLDDFEGLSRVMSYGAPV